MDGWTGLGQVLLFHGYLLLAMMLMVNIETIFVFKAHSVGHPHKRGGT